MKESDLELLKDGDLVFFHTRGFSPISWGIRSLTESYWNHVGVYYTDIHLRGYVIEALGSGVVETYIYNYVNNPRYDIAIKRFKLLAFKDKEEYDKGIGIFVHRMSGAIGKRYDWWAIAYLGLVYISLATNRKWAKYLPKEWNLFNSREKVFCSEIVCEASYGISSDVPHLFAGTTNQKCDSTTPRDIAKSIYCQHIYGIDKN